MYYMSNVLHVTCIKYILLLKKVKLSRAIVVDGTQMIATADQREGDAGANAQHQLSCWLRWMCSRKSDDNGLQMAGTSIGLEITLETERKIWKACR